MELGVCDYVWIELDVNFELLETLNAEETKAALEVTCFGAFLVAQQAAKRMLARGSGSIFFTGASAGVKGFANSSVFAMGKFGLRGLAQA